MATITGAVVAAIRAVAAMVTASLQLKLPSSAVFVLVVVGLATLVALAAMGLVAVTVGTEG